MPIVSIYVKPPLNKARKEILMLFTWKKRIEKTTRRDNDNDISDVSFFSILFFRGKNSLKIILKYYFYYNNIFKMSKCFLPYLIYMIHPWCVISFCSFSSSQAQALFLNHDESSNGWLILKCNSFLALRQFL